MIRSIIIFILVTASLYVLSLGVLTNVNYASRNLLFHTNNYYPSRGGNGYRKFIEFDPASHYDIVCIGASRCYRVYDPQIFEQRGYRAYNLATYNQTVENTCHLIEEYLDANNTGCLVFDLADVTFSTTTLSLESDLDLVMNAPDLRVPEDILRRDGDIRVMNTFVSRLLYRNKLLNPAEKNYRAGGYCFNTDSISRTECNDLMQGHATMEKDLVWDETRFDWLERLIEVCEQKHLKLIPVIGPLSKFYTEERKRTSHEKFERILAKHGLSLFDFGDLQQINSCDHFYDHGHLNQAGVSIYIPYLIDHLAGELPTPTLPQQ